MLTSSLHAVNIDLPFPEEPQPKGSIFVHTPVVNLELGETFWHLFALDREPFCLIQPHVSSNSAYLFDPCFYHRPVGSSSSMAVLVSTWPAARLRFRFTEV
ncbi:hypothetical protein Mapa_011852 [Marchantia paleacea]|nr:hypothetical protein Mapa_011852 [Marchantia paleacea]